MNACVVVLGDVGRSPRMQYHTLSLAKNNFSVDLIAYKGSRPVQEIENNDQIKQSLMSDVPQFKCKCVLCRRFYWRFYWRFYRPKCDR